MPAKTALGRIALLVCVQFAMHHATPQVLRAGEPTGLPQADGSVTKEVFDAGDSGENLLRPDGWRRWQEGFERDGETVVVAWAPLWPGDDRDDKRVAATLFWPDGATAEIYDLAGRRITHHSLRRKTTGQYYVKVDVEPTYIVVHSPSDRVRW